ncbi:hypothetical protein MASR2M70_00240 [Bacillota bacterium]
MEERNKVQVKIYGQEFTISGELPREHIIKVADHVDRGMHQLAKELPSCPASSLAVLTAVNCADEYYRTADSLNDQKAKNQQLERDAQHYVQLWDEAKKNFLQYKEDAQSAVENRDEMQQAYKEKTSECRELITKVRELEQDNENLKSRNEGLTAKMSAKEEEKDSAAAIIRELESKCRETESIFFDLQMENIRLKGELDRIKKDME